MAPFTAVLAVLALATPCEGGETQASAECEAKEVLAAIRGANASKLLAYVGPKGVTCGDMVLSRSLIQRALADRGSQLYAWLFDERTFQAKFRGTASHSLAYSLRREVIVRVAASQLSPEERLWEVVYYFDDDNHSAVFRWNGSRWEIAASGIFCM